MQWRVTIAVEACRTYYAWYYFRFCSKRFRNRRFEYIHSFRIAIAYFIKIDLSSERTVKRVVYVRIACVVPLSFEISLSN